MTLLNQTHTEEKGELNDTIQQLETGKKQHSEIEERLARLESSFSLGQGVNLMSGVPSRHVSGESGGMGCDMLEVGMGSREQPITLTFGDIDTTPTSLERFSSHYGVVNEINT